MSHVAKEWIRCGKQGCRKCPHGPYLYEYFRQDGRLKKKYIGKAFADALPDDEPDEPLAVVEEENLTQDQARVILGVAFGYSFTEMRQSYRDAVRALKPMDAEVAAARYVLLKAAWKVLRGDRR